MGLLIAVVVGIMGLIWSMRETKAYQQLYQYAVEISGGKVAAKPVRSFLTPIIDELSQVDEGFKE